MPFRNALRAETTAFDQGCGLHCLAHAFVLNLRQGRFQPAAEEDRCLKTLLEGFKAQYPAANTLTTAELKQILVNDLRNPVHREVVLSRVLRGMLADPAYHAPGVQVGELAVQRLANRLGMKVECYGTLDALARAQLRADGVAETPESLARARADVIRAPGIGADYETRNSLPPDAADVPAAAPVLKLLNEYGGHWEWEYNIHGDDAVNIAEVGAHNILYPAHRVRYGKNNARHASVYGNELQARFNQALMNRARLYASGQRLSSELNAFENEIALREARVPAPAPVPAANLLSTAGTASTPGTPSPVGGLMGLLGPIFSAFMPALTAPASRPAMNTAVPVVGNVLKAISQALVPRDFQAPVKEQVKRFDGTPAVDAKGEPIYTEKWLGYNGTKYKGASFGYLASVVLGWVGDIFNFFGGLIGFSEQLQKADTSRPLEDSEIKTAEDELFVEFMRFLPEQAAASLKKKLYAEWRNAAIPREKILNDLREALLEHNLITEHDRLLFKQHLEKLDPATKRQLQIQYHRLQGGPLVWKSLADHLARKGLMKEASEILNREEYQVLNEGFVAEGDDGDHGNDHPDPAPLDDAREYYGEILNSFAAEAPTRRQYQARQEMLAAIKRGGNNDQQILEDLENIFGEYRAAVPQNSSGHGVNRSEGFQPPVVDRPVTSVPPRSHIAQVVNHNDDPAGWTEKDWDLTFKAFEELEEKSRNEIAHTASPLVASRWQNMERSFETGQQNGASVSPRSANGSINGFRPGYAVHTSRPTVSAPVTPSGRDRAPFFEPAAAANESGTGRGRRRMGRRTPAWTEDGREIVAELVD